MRLPFTRHPFHGPFKSPAGHYHSRSNFPRLCTVRGDCLCVSSYKQMPSESLLLSINKRILLYQSHYLKKQSKMKFKYGLQFHMFTSCTFLSWLSATRLDSGMSEKRILRLILAIIYFELEVNF